MSPHRSAADVLDGDDDLGINLLRQVRNGWRGPARHDDETHVDGTIATNSCKDGRRHTGATKLRCKCVGVPLADQRHTLNAEGQLTLQPHTQTQARGIAARVSEDVQPLVQVVEHAGYRADPDGDLDKPESDRQRAVPARDAD